MTSPFVGDDLEEILGGVAGRSAPSTAETHAGHSFRPLNTALHGVSHRLWGWEPLPFHLTSLVLHLVGAALVVVLVRRLAAWFAVDPPRWWAPVAGAWFAVAPNHVEAVAWVAARADVAATVAALAALVCWCRPDRSRWGAAAALGWFAAALASKESAVVLPAIVVLLEVARDRGAGGGRGAMRSLPWWAVLAGYAVVRRVALGRLTPSTIGDDLLGGGPGAWVRGLGSLVVRSFLPGLGFGAGVAVGVALAVGVAVTAVVAVVSGRGAAPEAPSVAARRLAAALAGAVVVAVAPVVSLGVSGTTTGGERLVHLASVFAAALVAWPLALLVERRRGVGVTVGAVVLTAATVSLHLVDRTWADAATRCELATEALRTLPSDRPVLVVATPDTVDGVPCLRNAVTPTLEVAGWRRPEVVSDLVQVARRGRADGDGVRVEAAAEATAGSSAVAVWRVELTEPDDHIVSVSPYDGVEVVRLDDRTVELRVAPDAPRVVRLCRTGVVDVGDPCPR